MLSEAAQHKIAYVNSHANRCARACVCTCVCVCVCAHSSGMQAAQLCVHGGRGCSVINDNMLRERKSTLSFVSVRVVVAVVNCENDGSQLTVI